jgi:hypothetical protein
MVRHRRAMASLEGCTAAVSQQRVATPGPSPFEACATRKHLRVTEIGRNFVRRNYAGSAVSTSFTQYDVPIGITSSLKL